MLRRLFFGALGFAGAFTLLILTFRDGLNTVELLVGGSVGAAMAIYADRRTIRP